MSVPGNVIATIHIANDLGEQVVELSRRAARRPSPGRRGRDPRGQEEHPGEVGQVVGASATAARRHPTGQVNHSCPPWPPPLNGQAGHLRELISASSTFSREFLAYQDQFEALLRNAPR